MAANVLTVGDITKGKIVATDLLRTFITYLIVGPDVKCRNSMSKNRKIDSVYIRILCLLQGQEKKKPEQNLQAGVVIKSTSDRK